MEGINLMNIDFGKIIVFDGSMYLHRSLKIDEVRLLATSRGERIGGVYNVLRSLEKEMRKHPGYFPIFTWDSGLSKRRTEIYPNYKKALDKRIEAENVSAGIIEEDVEGKDYLNDYVSQRAILMDILAILGVPSLRYRDVEGDDLMALLSRMSSDTIISTDDKDMIQLLAPTTIISRTMQDQVLIYEDYQVERNDPSMYKFKLVKSMVGDPSDNIPKVADGLGEKSAERIADVIINNPDNWREVLEELGLKSARVRGTVKAVGTDWKSKEWRDHFFAPHTDKEGNPVIDKRKGTQKVSVLPPELAFIENYEQFTINYQLTDLDLVEFDEEFINDVSFTIVNGIRVPNYFNFMSKVTQYEFKKLDSQGLVSRMTSAVNLYKSQHNL